MEINLLPYIEALDHNVESEWLIDELYREIKNRIESPIFQLPISDIVFEMYNRLYRERSLSMSKQWWVTNYSLYKSIRYDIEHIIVEPKLSSLERQSNINLIDSILFYIKLMMLQISLQAQQRAKNSTTASVTIATIDG